MMTLKKIATDAYNDILTLQARLDNARTLFCSIVKLAQDGSIVEKLALMGEEGCEEWINNAQVWLETMDANFDALEVQSGAPQPGASASCGCGKGGAAMSNDLIRHLRPPRFPDGAPIIVGPWPSYSQFKGLTEFERERIYSSAKAYRAALEAQGFRMSEAYDDFVKRVVDELEI